MIKWVKIDPEDDETYPPKDKSVLLCIDEADTYCNGAKKAVNAASLFSGFYSTDITNDNGCRVEAFYIDDFSATGYKIFDEDSGFIITNWCLMPELPEEE